MKKEIYMIQYWFPTQSRVFSEPQCFVTENETEYYKALEIAKANRYEVVISGKFPVDHNTKTIDCTKVHKQKYET